MADRDRVADAPLSGAIVAGGMSARFAGQPKGLRVVGGIRIIDRVAAALRQIVRTVVLVANDPQASGWLPDTPVHSDGRPERGSLVGLETAIRHARGPVVVVAWDMPFVSPELLALIVRSQGSGAGAVVPEGRRGLEPMCALYTQECLPAIERALDRGELRLSSVLTQMPRLVRIPVARVSDLGDPDRLFFNVNTQAQLEAAERMARSR